MLLTDFDPEKHAVINPDMMFRKVPDFPETLVSVFSHQLFKAVLDFLGGRCRRRQPETHLAAVHFASVPGKGLRAEGDCGSGKTSRRS